MFKIFSPLSESLKRIKIRTDLSGLFQFLFLDQPTFTFKLTKMKGNIIPFTEEEFDARLEGLLQKALENYVPSKEEKKYRTRKKVAKKLHISLPTLNEYTKSGKLKGYRIMGRLLYSEDEVDAA